MDHAPQVTVSNFDCSVRSVATCPNHIGDSSLASLVGLFGPATNVLPQPQPTVVRPLVTSTLYANPDDQYLSAIVEHTPGEVVVVRGQEPTFPDTRDGDPVTSPAQVRYWSMCTNEYANPYRVTDCAADHETRIVLDGRYSYVISTPADRPANAGTANGVTWLDWGRTTVDGVLVMRHRLPDPSVAESIMSVPPGNRRRRRWAPTRRRGSTARRRRSRRVEPLPAACPDPRLACIFDRFGENGARDIGRLAVAVPAGMLVCDVRLGCLHSEPVCVVSLIPTHPYTVCAISHPRTHRRIEARPHPAGPLSRLRCPSR